MASGFLGKTVAADRNNALGLDHIPLSSRAER